MHAGRPIYADPAPLHEMIRARDAEIAALRARVAELEAVERAAREVCDEADEPEAAIVRLDAALAALEVPRG